MTLLNAADQIRLGCARADNVWAGLRHVWPQLYHAAVLADEPCCYYRLAGHTLIDEIGGPDAIASSSVIERVAPSLLRSGEAASVRLAARPNGEGIVIPDNPATRHGTGAYSVELWLAPTVPTAPAWQGLFGQNIAVPVYSVTVRSESAGLVGYSQDIGGRMRSQGILPFAPTLRTGRSYHLVWTYTAPIRRSYNVIWTLYIGGVQVRSQGVSLMSAPVQSADPLRLGGALALSGTQYSFGGYLQDLAIYDKVLSGERVAAHFRAARALAR